MNYFVYDNVNVTSFVDVTDPDVNISDHLLIATDLFIKVGCTVVSDSNL